MNAAKLTRTENLLKPLILPLGSCISTSSFAEASAVEGPSDSGLRVREGAIMPVWAVRGERLCLDYELTLSRMYELGADDADAWRRWGWLARRRGCRGVRGRQYLSGRRKYVSIEYLMLLGALETRHGSVHRTRLSPRAVLTDDIQETFEHVHASTPKPMSCIGGLCTLRHELST